MTPWRARELEKLVESERTQSKARIQEQEVENLIEEVAG